MKKVNWKTLVVSILISLGTGGIAWLLTMDSMQQYESMPKPPLSPPGWLFPVVWTLLFILMGIASARIYESDHKDMEHALKLYGLQLIVNIGWSVIFFAFGKPFLAFVWLVFLWYLILLTIQEFEKIDKIAAYLLYPYLIWVTFAGYLNLAIVLI